MMNVVVIESGILNFLKHLAQQKYLLLKNMDLLNAGQSIILLHRGVFHAILFFLLLKHRLILSGTYLLQMLGMNQAGQNFQH